MSAPDSNRTTSRFVAAAYLLAALAVACTPEAEPEPLRTLLAVPQGESGTLAIAPDGTLRFRPCDAAQGSNVEDDTGEDLRRIVEGLAPGTDSVNAHLVREGERVTELRVAAPEVRSCTGILPDAQLEARGNEPFWNVQITGTRALFRSPEELTGVEYEEGVWQRIDGGWRFQASRVDAPGATPLTLEVRSGRCTDTMSGALYPFRAMLERDDLIAEGCAFEGHAL